MTSLGTAAGKAACRDEQRRRAHEESAAHG